MDNTELSYLAGFFDGEGCIFIMRQKNYHQDKQGIRTVCPNLRYQLRIQLTNTNKEIMDWISTLGWYVLERKDLKKQWKRCWVGKKTDLAAYQCLKEMLPFLRVKKEEAKVAIEFQEHKNNMKSNGRNGLSQEEVAYRESIKAKLSELKNQNI